MGRAGKAAIALLATALCLAGIYALARRPLASQLVAHASRLEQAGETLRVDRALALALRLEPESVEGRLLRARRLQLDGSFTDSQALIEGLDQDALPLEQQLDLLRISAVNRLRQTRHDEADRLLNQALGLARHLGDRRSAAILHVELGRLAFYHSHNYELARQLLETARRLADEGGFEGAGAEAGNLLGQLLWWWKQEIDDPRGEYFEPALEIFRRRGDRYNEADTLHKIAFFHAYAGNLLEFFRYQDQSIALREELGDRSGLAHEYLTLGWAYLRLFDYRRAQRYLEKSLEVNAESGDHFAWLRSQRLLATCERGQGLLDEAEARLRRALESDGSGSAPENPFLWAELGELALRRNRPLEARRHFQRALETEGSAQIGGSNKTWLLAGLSASYRATGSLDEAAAVIAEIETLANGMNHSTSLRRLLLERAALAEARGERRAAFRDLLEAEELQLRSVAAAPVPSDTTSGTHEKLLAMLLETAVDPALPPLVEGDRDAHAKLAFALLEQRSYGFFRDLVVLSLGHKRRDQAPEEEALETLRRISRGTPELSAEALVVLREAYGGYEDLLLRRAISDSGYDALRRARPRAVDDLQAGLDDETALLQYVLAQGKAFCLVIRRDGLRTVALPVERRRLPAKIRLFRGLAVEGSGEAEDDWKPVASELHRLLIEPLTAAGALAGVKRLGIVPYGELHDVPFAALYDGDRQRLLIEDFDLFLLPAASLADPRQASGGATDGGATDGGATDGGVLALGIQEASDPELPALPFAVREAEAAVATLGGRAWTRDQATETRLKAESPHYRYLHLATHGVSEPRMPLLSHLVLGATDRDDGRLTVGEVFQLDLHAELVVLAGCRTGLSSTLDGSRRGPVGRLGLIQAFLHSGARSVLASLAPISDAAALELMKSFYAGLADGDRPAALARAQRAMASGELPAPTTDRTLRHPRHWAPYILVGPPS